MNDTQQSGAGQADKAAQENETGRDERGRFTRNNKGGPGNPFARRVAALRQAGVNAVSEEDLAEIIVEMVECAKDGDVAAARLVLSYTLGKPGAAPEPDRLD